jgi:uncharacterized RDD family membrane protein YckC
MTSPPATDRVDVLGRRIGAGLLDLLVVIVLMVVLGLLIGESQSGDGTYAVRLAGLDAVVWVVLSLLYYGVTEAATGQTLGKRLLGVRVARLDGSRPGAGAIAVRTLLRVIDGIFFYLVGLVAVLATGQRRQRLGDLAAGTTVVPAGATAAQPQQQQPAEPPFPI